MTSSLPLVFLNLLADRKLQPGAVLLHFSPGESTSLETLLSHSGFADLAAGFPCFIGAEDAEGLSAELRQRLQDAGCRWLDTSKLFQAAPPARPGLPESVEWVAGEWFLAPPAKPNGNQSASRALALKLVQLVAADADTRQIEDIFRQDPTLSYHLLRLVNSLSMGSSKVISSFSQAILILGRQQLRRWLNLMLFAARKDDHRAAMLLGRVAIRARSMEIAAHLGGLDKAGQELSFMAGMFSMLGTLFGLPLVDVLKPLQVSDALVDAVLRRGGVIGSILRLVECAERGDAAGVAGLLDELHLSVAEFNQLQIEACEWMLSLTRRTQGGGNA